MRENTIEDAWELCLSGRLLSGLLREHALCQLSICARKFLDFRTHTIKIDRLLRPSLLKAMASGRLVELTELKLTGGDHLAIKDMPLVATAFRGLKNLEVFHLNRCPLETATTVLAEGLTLTARAKLKDLSMDVIAPNIDMHYPRVNFKGFTNLSSLCLCMFNSSEEMPPVLEALYQGEFPALKYLRLISTHSLGDEIPRLVDSLRQGSLRQVKHFCLINFLMTPPSITSSR